MSHFWIFNEGGGKGQERKLRKKVGKGQARPKGHFLNKQRFSSIIFLVVEALILFKDFVTLFIVRQWLQSSAENTHLLCKRKYHWTADLLFYLFYLSWFDYVKLSTDLHVWSHPNQTNRRSAVLQWHFHLQKSVSIPFIRWNWLIQVICCYCILLKRDK